MSTMFPTLDFSALLFSFLTILPTFHAWQFSTTNVDLSSPPPINIGDSVVNGKPLVNYTTDITGWPCYNYPVPANVPRTPFPISGGKLSFTLTNNSVGSLWDYQYIGDIYLGQISLGDGTYSIASQDPTNIGFEYVDTDVWDDFSTGPDCSDTIDVMGAISRALGEDVTAASVVGMNATFGMRIVLFGPNPLVTDMVLDDDNVEEMYQCGYVTFTDKDLSNDPNAGYCNGGAGASPTASSAAAPSTLVPSLSSWPTWATAIPRPTPPPHPVPTPGNSTVVVASSSHTHTVAIGAGIGVSMGASLLILIVAFIVVRRRKARKHSETIGADIIVARPQDAESMKGGKYEEGVESSGSSTHSEPLPPYTAAREILHGHLKQEIDGSVSEV